MRLSLTKISTQCMCAIRRHKILCDDDFNEFIQSKNRKKNDYTYASKVNIACG